MSLFFESFMFEFAQMMGVRDGEDFSPTASRSPSPPPTVLPLGGNGDVIKDLGRQIMACPHIVDNIVAFANRKTQLTCLRVSLQFQDAAAKIVYRCISMDTDDMRGIMKGALIGHKVDENLRDCLFFHPKTKTPFDRGAERCPQPRSKSRWKRSAKKRSAKKRSAEAKQQKKRARGGGGVEPTVAAVVVTPAPADGAPTPQFTPAPLRNFKARLLKRVRVLTVGSHHRCLCSLYGPVAAELFSNVDILRIVPFFQQMFQLNAFCDRHDDTCPLVSTLRPRKIVFRNMDGSGLCVNSWKCETLKELVYVLPTDGRRYNNTFMETKQSNYRTMLGLMGLADHFEGVEQVKVVFYKDWEGWNVDHELVGRVFHGQCPVPPDDIVYALSDLIDTPRSMLRVVGLECLEFDAEGDLIDTYKRIHPNCHLNNSALIELVKRELRTEALQMAALLDDYDDDEINKEDSGVDPISYVTTRKYDKYREMFPRRACAGEINADD